MTELMQTHLEVVAPATTSSARQLRSRAAELARELGASQDAVDDVRLAVNEALTNVAKHAYLGGSGSVEMVVDHRDDELTVLVRDHGVGLEYPSESDGAGYGLLIIERTTLRSSFVSTLGRGTEVTMVFSMPPDESP